MALSPSSSVGGGGGGGDATEATLQAVKTGTDRIPATPAQEHALQTSPAAVRLSDGALWYKATTPADVQPISAAALPLPVLAAQEHVLALSPHAVRLSDGALFIVPALTGQLPGALVGGRLDVNLGSAPAAVTLVEPVTVDAADLDIRNLVATQDGVKAREETVAMTWVHVKSAAPAANAVQADTGALAAGEYDFDIQLVCSDTVAVGKGLVVEHRNAANAATLFNLGGAAPSGALQLRLRRYTLALNERLRVIAGTAAGTAASMYVSAIGRRLS